MTIFIDLCNDYPEAFKTLLDCSLRKKILPRVFFKASRNMKFAENGCRDRKHY